MGDEGARPVSGSFSREIAAEGAGRGYGPAHGRASKGRSAKL